MNSIFYKNQLIGAESFDSLDFELQEEFGFDYDAHDDFVEIKEGFGGKIICNTWEASPVKIDKLIEMLLSYKEKGADYVEIEDNPDSHGYDLSFFKIAKATEGDIKKLYSKRKAAQTKAKKQQIKDLKDRLKRLETEE